MPPLLCIWAPKGIVKLPGECWKLLLSLYWTRQAGADWKTMIMKIILDFWFVTVNLYKTVFATSSTCSMPTVTCHLQTTSLH
jgi:hypothetical protein